MRSSHGGRRPGAGRKSTYGEPTKALRVPESLVPDILEILSKAGNQTPDSRSASAAAIRSVLAVPSESLVNRKYRRVKAAPPDGGDEEPGDPVELGRHLVRNAESTFVMPVRGWSMKDAGIADGDELVVDRAIVPESGRVVVAEIGGELTVKRLRRTAKGWTLAAANDNFSDVHVRADSQLSIWGVVTYVLHKP